MDDRGEAWPPPIGAHVAHAGRTFEVVRMHAKPRLGEWIVLRRAIDGGVESRSVFRDEWVRGGYHVMG